MNPKDITQAPLGTQRLPVGPGSPTRQGGNGVSESKGSLCPEPRRRSPPSPGTGSKMLPCSLTLLPACQGGNCPTSCTPLFFPATLSNSTDAGVRPNALLPPLPPAPEISRGPTPRVLLPDHTLLPGSPLGSYASSGGRKGRKDSAGPRKSCGATPSF